MALERTRSPGAMWAAEMEREAFPRNSARRMDDARQRTAAEPIEITWAIQRVTRFIEQERESFYRSYGVP